MAGEQGWRIPTDASDYLLFEQKKGDLDLRRPNIRRAADLVGPGIGQSAVVITDFNDVLATFNGFFSSLPGALHAPNPTGEFVGIVSVDATMGGIQVFTDLTTGDEFRRRFNRYPGDESVILWGEWEPSGGGISVRTATDFNAAFESGFYAIAAGSSNAPVVGNLVGTVVFDEDIGGVQRFTEVATGIEWSRTFFGTIGTLIWLPWTRSVQGLDKKRVQEGTFTLAVASTDSVQTVTFATPFTAAPLVLCSVMPLGLAGALADYRWGPVATSTSGFGSTTQFVFQARRTTGTTSTIRVNWLAVGLA